MPQNAENVLDHFELFRGPEYQQMLANKKKMFENPRDPAEVERVREWAKTEEYKEKNEGPLPDRTGRLVRDILNFIADRKKRIERLKQTILVLSGPEPSPIPPMSPRSFSRTRGRVAEFIPPS